MNLFHKKSRKDAGDKKRKIDFEKWANSPRVQFLNKFSLLFQGILACALVFVIEWVSRHSFLSAAQFCVGTPLTFLYNALLVFASFLLVYFFKRRTVIRLILTIFWLLLGIINGCVLANRVTPFNFTDLKLVGDLLSMQDSKYFSFGQEVAVVAALALVIGIVVWLAIKGPKFQGAMHRIRSVVGIVAVLACIPFLTKAAIHSDILAGYFGNLAQGYQEYGFVYSFASSVVDTGMSKPDDYSEETIDDINDNVQVAETQTDEQPNIIFVQLETFADPYELNFLSYSEDPTPVFHSLMQQYTSGTLTVPVVGAGTANTEFEVLTGMSLQYFGLGEYPYKTVLKDTPVESIADDLKQVGYSTHALHNNGGNFYGRATVFSQMGFDTFTSKELMNITDDDYNEIHSWPKDDILIEETNKTLDSTEGQSDFIYTISVQSHGSYPTYKVFDDPAIKVTGGATEEENYQWEYYINELHEVDTVLGELIQSLSERQEDTILVLYGDHLPTMGLEDSDITSGSIYHTTYCTWNNFGLEKNDKDVTTYQLASYITEQLGIHEGTMFTYHQSQMDAGTADDDSYLSGMELLQFDLLYGERYSYGGIQKYTASDLEMGVEDVVLSGYDMDETTGMIQIHGENFTPWSYVYVNGEKVDTTYVSDTLLTLKPSDVKDGDTLVVNQVGSSSTVFRSSNETTFTEPADYRSYMEKADQYEQQQKEAEEAEEAEAAEEEAETAGEQ